MDDAFSYAERRLCGRGALEDSSIDPKDSKGKHRPDLDPLMARAHKKVFTGIAWRERQVPLAPAPAEERPGLFLE